MKTERTSAFALAAGSGAVAWLLVAASWQHAAAAGAHGATSGFYHAATVTLICGSGAIIAAWYALSLLIAACTPIATPRRYFAPGALRLVRLLAAVLAAIAMPLGAASATPMTTGISHGDVLPPLPAPPPDFAPVPPVSTQPLPAPGESTRPAHTAAPAPHIHVVAPGECLWQIAQSYHRDGSDAEIAAHVAQLHADNPGITDPNLIYPGQRLILEEHL